MDENELKQHILRAAKTLRDAMVTDPTLRERKVEEVRLHYLGRKGGVVTEVMRNLKNRQQHPFPVLPRAMRNSHLWLHHLPFHV